MPEKGQFLFRGDTAYGIHKTVHSALVTIKQYAYTGFHVVILPYYRSHSCVDVLTMGNEP
jgi:hypothetical protein